MVKVVKIPNVYCPEKQRYIQLCECAGCKNHTNDIQFKEYGYIGCTYNGEKNNGNRKD